MLTGAAGALKQRPPNLCRRFALRLQRECWRPSVMPRPERPEGGAVHEQRREDNHHQKHRGYRYYRRNEKGDGDLEYMPGRSHRRLPLPAGVAGQRYPAQVWQMFWRLSIGTRLRHLSATLPTAGVDEIAMPDRGHTSLFITGRIAGCALEISQLTPFSRVSARA